MKNGDKCWVVGKKLQPTATHGQTSASSGYIFTRAEASGAWEFVGVFANETDAVRHCLSSDYFVGPAVVGEAYPDETTKWVGAYFTVRPYRARGNAF